MTHHLMIDYKDLRIIVPSIGMPGGQHTNVIETGVEITHIPTGIKVFCGSERSQLKNRDLALAMVEAALNQIK